MYAVRLSELRDEPSGERETYLRAESRRLPCLPSTTLHLNMSSTSALREPLLIGNTTLRNRILMSSLTRSRSAPADVPTVLNVQCRCFLPSEKKQPTLTLLYNRLRPTRSRRSRSYPHRRHSR